MAAPARLSRIRSVLSEPALVRFLIAVLVAWGANSAVSAFLSIRLVSLGAPASLVGSAWALGAIVEIPLMFALPRLASRWGGDRLVVAGAALFALRALSIALLDDPVRVLATMVLAGGGFALLLVGGVTYVARHAPAGAEATTQGMLAAVVYGLAMILGSGLGGLGADALGLDRMFLLAFAIALVAVVGLAFAVVAEDAPDKRRRAAAG
ncbi:MAG: MFS transporter [Candidatus Limnocylindria bacterium]